jgi:16S rRNA (guanine(966)-N(2))-methyltransferase RsmD
MKLRSLPMPILRPMLDRVKESLFNILRDDIAGCRVLDLFSGSGALGLEALSRGAASCVFVEQNPRLAALVMENAQRCHLAECCELIQASVHELPHYRPTVTGVPADIVLAGPPYEMVDDPNKRTELFRALEDLAGHWVGPDALVVLHHRPMPYALWPTSRLRQTDQRVYGRSQLTFFKMQARGRGG